MKKNKILLAILLFTIVLTTLNYKSAYAKTQKYCVDVFKNVVVQKGKKAKLYSNTYSKIKWKCNSKKVKINKKGVLKANKKGVVKVSGKTKSGKKITVKVTIKKKIIKATSKTVKVNVMQEKGKESFKFSIKNNSDEGIMIAWICGLKQKVNGVTSYVPKKQIQDDTYPYIFLEPQKTFSDSGYGFDKYEMMNDGMTYVLDLNVIPGYKIPNKTGRFSIQGEFIYNSTIK